MHTDAHLSIPSHRYTHAYVSTRTRTHEEMGCSRTQMGPRMRVHLGIRTCLEAPASMHIGTDGHGTAARAHTHAHMRTLPWHRFAHPYQYMCPYIRAQMYAPSDTRLVGARVCRSRRALTRTYEHAHTLAWNLHAHTYACTCTQT